MKVSRSKYVHTAQFLVFAALPSWLVLSSDSTVVKVLMLGLIALMAKWAFFDGFAAADRDDSESR